MSVKPGAAAEQLSGGRHTDLSRRPSLPAGSSVPDVPRTQWSRTIAKRVILFRAELSEAETWTFVAWLAPKTLREPDFVFPTLSKSRQYAQRLMEMSLEDELNFLDGLARPYFDFEPVPVMR